MRLNFNPKRNFGKETSIKLFKVADELFHLNSTINHLVILPIIYHEVSIVLMSLYITCLLYVRHFTFIVLLHISTSWKIHNISSIYQVESRGSDYLHSFLIIKTWVENPDSDPIMTLNIVFFPQKLLSYSRYRITQ